MATFRKRPRRRGSSDRPTVPPLAAPDGPIAIDRLGFGPELTAVAEVVGSVVVPQIRVGSPSPSGEPTATARGYRTFPFRPDTVIDGWSTDLLTVRGASTRGHLHRYNGTPRQDDFAIHAVQEGRVIVAVADGVSAAQHSHVGASAATRYATGWLCTHLREDVAQTDWVALMKSVAWELNEQVQTLLGLAEPDPVRAESELATTLVCAVIEPLEPDALRAHLVGIGDSGAWVLSAAGFTPILGGKAVSDEGVASSAVTGLPRVPTDLSPVVVEISHGEVLLIGTDGIGDPLGDGEGGVGKLFRDVLTGLCPPSLIEFAHAVDFSRENFDDDRTLVAVWPKQPEQIPR